MAKFWKKSSFRIKLLNDNNNVPLSCCPHTILLYTYSICKWRAGGILIFFIYFFLTRQGFGFQIFRRSKSNFNVLTWKYVASLLLVIHSLHTTWTCTWFGEKTPSERLLSDGGLPLPNPCIGKVLQRLENISRERKILQRVKLLDLSL